MARACAGLTDCTVTPTASFAADNSRDMAIDGLIILESTNVKPIVQTSFRSFPPAYPLLHIDAYSAALEKAARPDDIDPVLLVTLPDAPTACCHLQHRSLTILCPISGDRELFGSRYAYMRSFRRCTYHQSTHYMHLRSSAPFSTFSSNTLARSPRRLSRITLTSSTNSSRRRSMRVATRSPRLRTLYETSCFLLLSSPKSSLLQAFPGSRAQLQTT